MVAAASSGRKCPFANGTELLQSRDGSPSAGARFDLQRVWLLVQSESSCGECDRGTTIELSEQALLDLVRVEAQAARAAAGSLNDDAVEEALRAAALRLEAEQSSVLEANAADLAAAADTMDAGSLDRLTLDAGRIGEMIRQLHEMAELPPLEREIETWQLENGLVVSTRRIPIGVVGANFEARPNVAVDVASQLLKSLNACVLRTGGAALGTVTVLVDDVLRPALADAGLPCRRGRSRARAGAGRRGSARLAPR